MSAPPVRRKDKLMSDQQALEFLARGFCGRIASVGADGWPYCVPLLYVWTDGEVLVHNPAARGHFRANVEHNPRVCFEVDEAGEVFDYGRPASISLVVLADRGGRQLPICAQHCGARVEVPSGMRLRLKRDAAGNLALALEPEHAA